MLVLLVSCFFGCVFANFLGAVLGLHSYQAAIERSWFQFAAFACVYVGTLIVGISG